MLVANTMIEQNMRNKIEEFVALKDKESEKYFAWLRNIIGMAIAMMGILISLRTESRENPCANLIFSISISLISLGIISGALLLFAEIHLLRKEIEIRAGWIKKIIDDKKVHFEAEIIQNPWYFKIVKSICYISFISALISLAIFTYF